MFLGKLHTKTERDFPLSAMEGVPDDTPATIRIRLMTPGERREVFEAGYQTTYTPDEGGGLQPEMKLAHRKAVELLFQKAVIGWSQVFEDAEGKRELKFGMAGKRTFLDLLPAVADYAAQCHGKMVEEIEAAKEPEEKNS